MKHDHKFEDSLAHLAKCDLVPAVVVKLMAGRERVAKGWCQGYFYVPRPDSLGGDLMCPIRAVEFDGAAMAYLHAALPTGARTIVSWADAKGRTLAEILALFDRAIALVPKISL